MSSHVSVGISGVAVALPRAIMTARDMAQLASVPEAEILDSTGVRQKPVLSASESIIELAVHAARRALLRAGIEGKDVDYVAFTSAGTLGRRLWSPAAKIQRAINAQGAFSFEITNGCNAANLGLEIATSVLRKSLSKRVALVVNADALSKVVNYRDPKQKCLFSFSDAAGAVVLKRGEERNQLLSFCASTDAEFVDHLFIPPGEDLISMNDDEEEDQRLSAAYREMYPKMIRTAVAEAGASLDNIRWIFMNQGDHRLGRRMSESLQFPLERIYRSYENYGHLGGCDVFFGLNEIQSQGLVKQGDLVVMASSAVGFSWGASVVRI